jgi:hypothetical protein
MISLPGFIFLSPGALVDGEIDRSEKVTAKTTKKILIIGNKASFVPEFLYKFQYPYQRKNLTLDLAAC